ncbi:bifunctional acetate--CoA ligase family protein/GNAT family N-acetyltransferase [Alicyclobacillus cycloheptanicus]|uniref:Acyl-CoA synthetase (NDP forming)/RimJ/RimL family protein N-acetyltransferase n=1 Tax=Alicyclobacillus cycloheptanicus TaxID=1457 RepID=A0ABT9XIU6_9BACL|nr:GNAT family N-acetyltransferase [Alicyclobacillus cycloheptanicus]MDQ0190239.1 acyl-CoA synthetase (NDP forming)/RimJ/RimL family protein N-acetyltransferase [Alicyclobacillus cycloheptanicus]
MSRIILRDGRVAELRRAVNNEHDRAMIRALFRSASPESLYMRFFHAVREVSEQSIAGMIADGGPTGLSLLCLAGDSAIAIGSYARVDEGRAEVAFLVDDRYHGHGLGSLLLAHLAQAAWRYGYRQFEAYVLHENQQMIKVFQASGYELAQQTESTALHLTLPLRETERSRALQETREKLAAAASLHPFFRPKSVAVIGASRAPERPGHLLLKHILDGDYRGIVYPVNPTTPAVSAIRAYPSLTALPEPVDLAVVAVPAEQVPSVIEDCIAADARAVMVVSAGFGEVNEAGRAQERELARRLRASGRRLLGPNTLGLVNTAPDMQLNASLAPRMPSRGGLAIASHSGALGVAILEYASRIGVGVSSFVSLGNKVDVSVNDLLQFWEDDRDVDMVVLYLESFGNPRKFARIARRIARQKPILAVKSARTPRGSAISRLPGAADGAIDPVVTALFRQAGIIRVDTLQELFDVAALLATDPKPCGRRVAVVTNTAGGAVMAADTLQREGLEFIEPLVNLGFEALAEGYRQVLPQVLRDPNVDAVIVLFNPIARSGEEEVVAAIAEAVREVAGDPPTPPAGGVHASQKPVVANFLLHEDYHVRYIQAGERRIPVYPFPEQAVHALARVTDYMEDCQRPLGRVPDLAHCDPEAARAIIRAALASGASALSPAEAADVLVALGIRSAGVSATQAADRPEDSRSERLLSWLNRDALHTWDPGLAVRVALHPLFGPVVGLRWNESVVVRMTPLTDTDAEEMMAAVGAPQAAVDLLLRIARLAEEVPEVTEVTLQSIDCSNGLDGCRVGQVRIAIAKPDMTHVL